ASRQVRHVFACPSLSTSFPSSHTYGIPWVITACRRQTHDCTDHHGEVGRFPAHFGRFSRVSRNTNANRTAGLLRIDTASPKESYLCESRVWFERWKFSLPAPCSRGSHCLWRRFFMGRRRNAPRHRPVARW